MPSLKELYAVHQGKVSDKWELYLREYDRIFADFREKPVRMLEIGIQNGGSLEIWSSFFSRFEHLVGCDINPACASLRYDDPRVHVVVGDANTDRSEAEILGHSGSYNLIIDDGSHTSGDIVKSFARYFPHLEHGGVFVAEDLHCSYWKAFEGGLYYPYSSLTFFKRLADIVNHEHWGVPTERRRLLAGFSAHYSIAFSEELLADIHSIEFVNSMCVVRKCPAEVNRLGRRIITGSDEVAADLRHLRGSIASAVDESTNEWTALDVSPEEGAEQLVLDLDRRRREVEVLSAELAEMKSSRIWRVSAWARKIIAKINSLVRKPLRLVKKSTWLLVTPHRTPARIRFLRDRVRERDTFGGARRRLSHYINVFKKLGIRAARKIDRLLPAKLSRLLRRIAADRRFARLRHGSLAAAVTQPADEAVSTTAHYLSPPLNFVITDAAGRESTINVILPSLNLKHMSGGPNTALFFAAMLAERGERIRIICCDAQWYDTADSVFRHMDGLLQRSVARDRIELVDGFNRARKISIGAYDLFFATAWWTAQIAQLGLRLTSYKTMVYLIQDFEPILHEGSTFQALALETYGFDHIPVVNTRLLLDHLVKEKAGRFASAEFASAALCFEPALDRSCYFPDNRTASAAKKKVLLFYARPNSARRNLFELGIAALKNAVACGAITHDEWEVWGMGEAISSVPLGRGVHLHPLPWMSFDDYARRVRTADLLLSLMLSPHPSYPPLEMAASGKLVVTNAFSVKTPDRLRDLSPNILVAEPTVGSVAARLIDAAARINHGLPSFDPTGKIALPRTWDESLSDAVGKLLQSIATIRATPPNVSHPIAEGYPCIAENAYEQFRKDRLAARRQERKCGQVKGLVSFITSAYDTDPKFLRELGRSLLMQDGGVQFEWQILDNGSTRVDTKAALDELARYPGVRLSRVDRNLGIIGGMRFLLECANGRYIVPLDSDDIVEPDFAEVVTQTIVDHGYPALLYGDEDKLEGDRFHTAYFKPAWDPVLFLHSCYIAHPCVIDRRLALSLGCYTEPTAEGCHDWDSFLRFVNAGHTPVHIPEVLYSWRAHVQSTSSNIDSKSYISDSQRATLERALVQRQVDDIELASSPLFHCDVDWWFRCTRTTPPDYATVVLSPEMTLRDVAARFEQTSGERVHLRWEGVVPDDDEWTRDAYALMKLFPDTVMVGGMLHDKRRVVGGPCVFGFGGGFDCPDRGRLIADPGYSAWMFKPRSVSSVSTGHCVIDREFLSEALLQLIDLEVPVCALGPWLGAMAIEKGKRVVYSPFMRARCRSAPEDGATGEVREIFVARFHSHIPDSRYYSRHLGLTPDTAYQSVGATARTEHRKRLGQRELPHGRWLSQRIKERARSFPIPALPPTISLITTVYERLDLDLLEELADSVIAQTLPASEWIIVVDGPMPVELLLKLKANANGAWKAKVVERPVRTGIINVLRVGLEEATGEYIVPLDCDDLLTPDALAVLAHSIDRFAKPDMVYSDEDILQDGQPCHPYLRGAFDPVLNAESSYIWHLCAIARRRALELSLYSDEPATWCHDWNSVTKIADAGGRIEHVPEILYHWRQHRGSTTNNEAGDSRSLDSVRFVLERKISQSAKAANLYVADWPRNRGSRELYIARREGNLPPFVSLSDAAAADLSCDDDAILVIADRSVSIADRETYLEVARLFDLHPDVGAVGGLVVDAEGRVVDSCYLADEFGGVSSPWNGRDYRDPGPFALAQKPQTAAMTGRMLAFFRIAALKRYGLWPLDFDGESGSPVTKLCVQLAANDCAVAFSPLVTARCSAVCRVDAGSHQLKGPIRKQHALARYGR